MRTVIEIDWSARQRKKKAVQDFIEERLDALFYDLSMEELVISAASSVNHFDPLKASRKKKAPGVKGQNDRV